MKFHQKLQVRPTCSKRIQVDPIGYCGRFVLFQIDSRQHATQGHLYVVCLYINVSFPVTEHRHVLQCAVTCRFYIFCEIPKEKDFLRCFEVTFCIAVTKSDHF